MQKFRMCAVLIVLQFSDSFFERDEFEPAFFETAGQEQHFFDLQEIADEAIYKKAYCTRNRAVNQYAPKTIHINSSGEWNFQELDGESHWNSGESQFKHQV